MASRPTGRGVRPRISADLLWLPYVVNQYIESTGDSSILEESVPFLEGQAVPADKDDAYFRSRESHKRITGCYFWTTNSRHGLRPEAAGPYGCAAPRERATGTMV